MLWLERLRTATNGSREAEKSLSPTGSQAEAFPPSRAEANPKSAASGLPPSHFARTGTEVIAPLGVALKPRTLIWPPDGLSNSTVPRTLAAMGHRSVSINEVWLLAGRLIISFLITAPVSSLRT